MTGKLYHLLSEPVEGPQAHQAHLHPLQGGHAELWGEVVILMERSVTSWVMMMVRSVHHSEVCLPHLCILREMGLELSLSPGQIFKKHFLGGILFKSILLTVYGQNNQRIGLKHIVLFV